MGAVDGLFRWGRSKRTQANHINHTIGQDRGNLQSPGTSSRSSNRTTMGTKQSKQLEDPVGTKPVSKLPLLLLDLGPTSNLHDDHDETSPESGEESGGNDGPTNGESRSNRASKRRWVPPCPIG